MLLRTVAAEHAYGGSPPLWVYAEMAKPLVMLVGQEGYHIMVSWLYVRHIGTSGLVLDMGVSLQPDEVSFWMYVDLIRKVPLLFNSVTYKREGVNTMHNFVH